MGGENNNQQMAEVRVMMATGQSRGDDNINNVRPRPLNTQQPAIGRGWGGGNKDDKEEEYDGCWRMMGKVALAWEKRRGGAIAPCFVFGGGGTPLWMPPSNGGQRQQRWLETMYAFLGRGMHVGNNE